MKSLFLHDFLSSFFLWGNHVLGDKAECVHYATGQRLTLSTDTRTSGKYSYQSTRKPWCADESLGGKVTGVMVSGSPVSTTGMQVDYQNGRIISNTNLGSVITGNFHYQEVAVNISLSTEEEIVFENKYIPNHRFYASNSGPIPPYDYLTPCVFLSVDHHENTAFALGGEDETVVYAKAVIVCENDSDRETIMSVFADAAKTSFPEISADNFPFNEYFNVTGTYNFETLRDAAAGDSYFIESVKCSRLSRSSQTNIPQNLSVGFADIHVTKCRYPRA